MSDAPVAEATERLLMLLGATSIGVAIRVCHADYTARNRCQTIRATLVVCPVALAYRWRRRERGPSSSLWQVSLVVVLGSRAVVCCCVLCAGVCKASEQFTNPTSPWSLG